MSTFDFSEQPEDQRVACYGAFCAMAAADGAIDKEEVIAIFEVMDVEGLSPAAQAQVRGFLVEPPPLRGGGRHGKRGTPVRRHGPPRRRGTRGRSRHR